MDGDNTNLNAQSKLFIKGAGTRRRNLLSGVICGLACCMGGSLAAAAARFLLGAPEMKNETWSDAGDMTQLETGVPREVTFVRSRTDSWKSGNEKVLAWVLMRAAGRVTAFSSACTHLGCAYHWEAQKNTFVCPCHGSVFDAEGNVLAGPASRPLDRYLVKIEGGRLWLGPLETKTGI